MIPKTGEDRKFKLIPAGLQLARCVQVIDLGGQRTPWGTKDKVLLGWELPKILTDKTEDRDPEPMLKWEEFTCSLHPESNLSKLLESWRGAPFTDEVRSTFDLRNILDKPCQLNIVHNKKGEKTYANISAVVPVSEGMKIPDRHHKLVYFSLAEFDQEVFDTFGQKLQDKIKATAEYAQATGESSSKPNKELQEVGDEDIPF